jgi:hypothetical protein
MEKPKIEKASFTFTQEGNTCGSTDEVEELTIDCDSSLGIYNDKGAFFVLHTDTGWSIDDEGDIKFLLDKINQALQLFISK